MFGRQRYSRRQAGFTLMETLMAISLIVLAFTSILPLYYNLTSYLSSNRLKAEANAIAAREMERIRTAPYDSVGVIGGNPSGIFYSEKTENRSQGGSFRIATRIQWVDDPFDGTAAAGTDAMPNDYKLVTVTVFQTGKTTSSARLTSNIARESEEQPITGGNIIVKVYLSDGLTPIEDVQINIVAGPSAPLTNWTDTDGTTMFAQITPSVTTGDYAMRAIKSGFVTRIDQDVLNTTVAFGQTRTVIFIMDEPGSMLVRLLDQNGAVIETPSTLILSGADFGDISFSAQNGNFSFPQLLPGNYELKGAAAGYLASGAVAVTVAQGELTSQDITLQALPSGSLRLETFDGVSFLPLGNCTVKLTNQSNGQIINTVTDASGLLNISLEVATYTVDVTKANYQPYTGSAIITQGATLTLLAYLQGYPDHGNILVRAEDRSHNPRNGVRIRVTGPNGYYSEQSTGAYAPGECLFDHLSPGTYTVQRWGGVGWRYDRQVTVTAGNRSTVTYSY
jgi:type II secretory pathway pseudopilin PulG